MKIILIIISVHLFLVVNSVCGQNTAHTLSGFILDERTTSPLEAVEVYLSDNSVGATTDSLGYFEINGLLSGIEYKLTVDYLGYVSKELDIQLKQDTSLKISISEDIKLLDAVTVQDYGSDLSNSHGHIVSREEIRANSNKNLADLLDNVTGVSTLRNGNGMSKPIIHGLYGNRITLLNNGVTQGGQQWGNDHSPEIDPLVANQITVVKGASSLAYAGSNLGSVILVEPHRIKHQHRLSGSTTYFFETNGLGHGLNVQLENHGSFLAWRVNGTLKKNGDRKSPNYFLTNTGLQEANFALQLEKNIKDKWFLEMYASTFNTEIGIFKGSHVGNVTDLESAFGRAIPFFVEPNFSYKINPPRQVVKHHLLKLAAKHFFNDQQFLTITVSSQFNFRQEFDVRRNGRSNIPALSLRQITNFAGLSYNADLEKAWRISTGLQFNFIDNTNNPETDILPLIPDYVSTETGAFFIAQKQIKKSQFEFGGRYDHIYQYALTISRTLPRSIIRYKNHFHNFAISGLWTYEINADTRFHINLGAASRSPAINELYSFGLHQGVSGIEEGDIDLNPERSLKATIGIRGKIKKVFSWDVLAYYQLIDDYIYLKPQNEIRLTIRGAFPVFRYEQDLVQIFGLDCSGTFHIVKNLDLQLITSLIRGDNLAEDLPLINM
ncbi:MAG: TonB-dependent receptor, partial [Saprospiraceae bacterium]|nr:TonB-dependent receptor [Saprospiraceae bacterium]